MDEIVKEYTKQKYFREWAKAKMCSKTWGYERVSLYDAYSAGYRRAQEEQIKLSCIIRNIRLAREMSGCGCIDIEEAPDEESAVPLMPRSV